MHFNTSNVKVYRKKAIVEACGLHYFNTSNVKVYLFYDTVYDIANNISIHPMLKFITNNRTHQNHSSQISIHPMLKFIENLKFSRQTRRNFNTSNVKVYHVVGAVKGWSDENFNTSNVKVYQ